jgi:hypothetical protein
MAERRESYSENNNKNKIIEVSCLKCHVKTRHKIMCSYEYKASEGDFDRGFTVDWSSSHQIIQCQGCMELSFRLETWFSEDEQQIGENEWIDGTRITLYPMRSEHMIISKPFPNVPSQLRRIYKETIESYNNDLYTLAAAGLRSIVEGICANLKIVDGPIEITQKDGTKVIKRNKSLEGKISGLVEKGFLLKKNAEILHEHRALGNEAVHDLSQPSSDEIIIALDVIEHAFETIYEISEKGDDLKILRIKRKKKKK